MDETAHKTAPPADISRGVSLNTPDPHVKVKMHDQINWRFALTLTGGAIITTGFLLFGYFFIVRQIYPLFVKPGSKTTDNSVVPTIKDYSKMGTDKSLFPSVTNDPSIFPTSWPAPAGSQSYGSEYITIVLPGGWTRNSLKYDLPDALEQISFSSIATEKHTLTQLPPQSDGNVTITVYQKPLDQLNLKKTQSGGMYRLDGIIANLAAEKETLTDSSGKTYTLITQTSIFERQGLSYKVVAITIENNKLAKQKTQEALLLFETLRFQTGPFSTPQPTPVGYSMSGQTYKDRFISLEVPDGYSLDQTVSDYSSELNELVHFKGPSPAEYITVHIEQLAKREEITPLPEEKSIEVPFNGRNEVLYYLDKSAQNRFRIYTFSNNKMYSITMNISDYSVEKREAFAEMVKNATLY